MTRNYEESEEFNGKYYSETSYDGIAWRCIGWETEPDEDTEWSGIENRTGRMICHMVGDDRLFSFWPEDLVELNRGDFCGVCGQVGCHHDGYSE